MIFVILGTQKFQLNRLLENIDRMFDARLLEENVFAQIGNSTYKPKNFRYANFLEKEDFQTKIKDASLIITHSGVGSIIASIKYGKPVIVFPRLAKFNEHVDNHQLEIAKAFEKKGYVLCCNEDDDLFEKIIQARSFSFQTYQSSTNRIIDLIRQFCADR